MTTIERDLNSFADFARLRISDGNSELSLDELFDLWRAENPSEQQAIEDAEAIRIAIEDFRNGDRGVAAGELSRNLRRELESIDE